jgi:amino acid transporter
MENPGKTEPRLRSNSLSLWDSLAQTLGAMAPSGGIAVLIPLVFANAGNGTWLLYVPVIAGYALLAATLTVFASREASAGSFAAYGERAFGPLGGVIGGWTYLAAMIFAVAGTAPTVALCLLQALRGLGLGPAEYWAPLLVVAASGAAWWASSRDVTVSTKLMLAVECLSLGAILGLAALFLLRTGFRPDGDQLTLKGATPTGLRLGLILAFMSLTGFESVTALGEEARRPLSTIPRALSVSVIPVGLLFLVMAYVLVAAFRGSGLDLGQALAPFERLGAAAGARPLARVAAWGIVLSFFACLLGCLNAGGRLLFDLSRRGRFWAPLGAAHPRHATPARALLAVAAFGTVIPLAMLALGVRLNACVAYLDQICSLGFVATYTVASVSALWFLRGQGLMRTLAPWGSAAIFGATLIASIVPAPPYPWDLLPVVLLACIGAGSACSWLFLRRGRRCALSEAAPYAVPKVTPDRRSHCR